MQYRLATVFVAILVAALMFASCTWPLGLLRDQLSTVYVLVYATVLVIAVHSVGPRRTVFFTFSVFGILLSVLADPCPEALAIWVKHNVVHPQARQELGGYVYSVTWVMNYHISFLIASLAAVVARYFARGNSNIVLAFNSDFRPDSGTNEQNHGMNTERPIRYLGR